MPKINAPNYLPIMGFVVFLLLLSCNLQNTIIIEGNGKGSMEMSLALPPYMLNSIDIVAASIPGGENILKPENIAKSLSSSKDIYNPQVESSQKGAYNIRFRFENFQNNAHDFLIWQQKPNGSTELSIIINRKTYKELEQRFPAIRNNTLLQIYGPATTEGMSQQDYFDMIEYSFGPEAKKDLPKAFATIYVQVPGKILSQTGGNKQNNNRVEFRIPLLDLVLLKGEQKYSVIYR